MTAEGVHFVRSAKAGKPVRWYIYAWRGGPRVGEPIEQRAKPKLTPALIKAIAAAHAADDAPPDTVKGLSALWTASHDWKSNAESTRTTWGYSLVKIELRWGDVPLRVFGDPRMTSKIVKWRDEVAAASGPRAADVGITVLTRLCAWGMLNGRLICNPAAAVPPLWQGGNREDIIWTAEDCAAFDAVPKIPQWLVDARRLAEFTGLRRTDLCRLEWQHVTDTHIAITAAKKSRGRRKRVVMPIVPGLRELLEDLRTRHRAEGVEAVLVGTKGRPVKPATLTVEFLKYRNQANGGQGIVHAAEFDDEADRAKHLHDLRGSFATKLMTLPGGGLTDDQIALIMGWSVQQVAAIRKRYVDEAAIVVAIAQRMNAAR